MVIVSVVLYAMQERKEGECLHPGLPGPMNTFDYGSLNPSLPEPH